MKMEAAEGRRRSGKRERREIMRGSGRKDGKGVKLMASMEMRGHAYVYPPKHTFVSTKTQTESGAKGAKK